MIFVFEHATVDEIHDGDTFWAVIDLGVRVSTRQKVRMAAVRAVELDSARGPEARELLRNMLPLGLPIRLTSHRWTYDRLECDVVTLDGLDINARMRAALKDAGLEGGR